jgi:hypothetical protein
MRYKGHSSLKAAWHSGVRKLAFILDFDRFEDAYPELRNQRFFGFNRLAFSNAFNDPSLLRDKVAADTFRAAGAPAARTSFAAPHLDWGDGPVYLGLYTIIEDPCDRMLDTQLGDGSGNLYKPWGDAARWLDFDRIGEDELGTHFERCDGDDVSIPTDVVTALTALHADHDEPSAWRAGLEQVFDVPAFLKALAINQVIMNWDSYGCMHHNYFVYANPSNGDRLLWFPWDLNESMLARHQSGCPEPGSVMLDEIVFPDADHNIDTDWPLIQLLLRDSEYRTAYQAELSSVLGGAFAADATIARLQELHNLIAPYVVGPLEVEAYPYTNCTTAGFLNSLTTGDNALIPHIQARHRAVEAALEL